jgi:hypothetical protein
LPAELASSLSFAEIRLKQSSASPFGVDRLMRTVETIIAMVSISRIPFDYKARGCAEEAAK